MAVSNIEQSAFDSALKDPVDGDSFDRTANWPGKNLELSEVSLLAVGMQLTLRMARYVQWARMHQEMVTLSYKADGTPVTNIDQNAEILARNILAECFPDHLVVGEEGNADDEHVDIDPSKYTWCFDPIDSTNCFLSHENTSAITVTLWKDGKTVLSLVCNPFNGEIFYALGDQNSRLVRQYGFGGNIFASDLPLKPLLQDDYRFVNVQPRPNNDPYLKKLLMGRGKDCQIQKVIQTGGSPAWNLVSVAKKPNFAYVQQWGAKMAMPWEMAGAIHVIRNTPGGLVTDGDGRNIDINDVSGLIVASVSEPLHRKVLEIITS